jgi:light-regulated signal transduction histidine kinase (bacteriophytochrome)
MRELVEDLANYISLVQVYDKKQEVDLKKMIDHLVHENLSRIQQKNAQVLRDKLPLLYAYPSQLQLLFKALIDNSIKFSQPDVPPHIHIYGNYATIDDLKVFNINTPAIRYIKITLRDNGIGFDNEFAERMFGIFQRLHTQDSAYSGKGIGLAIVKRVITNHSGYVFAKGFPGAGAEFTLFFPVY